MSNTKQTNMNEVANEVANVAFKVKSLRLVRKTTENKLPHDLVFLTFDKKFTTMIEDKSTGQYNESEINVFGVPMNVLVAVLMESSDDVAFFISALEGGLSLRELTALVVGSGVVLHFEKHFAGETINDVTLTRDSWFKELVNIALCDRAEMFVKRNIDAILAV